MKRVDYWTNRAAWPFVKPGYLFLPEVFDRIGKETLGGEWTGREGSFTPSGDAPPSPKLVFERIGFAASGAPSFKIGDAGVYNRNEQRIADLLGLSEMQRLAGISYDQWAQAIDRWRASDLEEPELRRRRAVVFGLIHSAAASDIITTLIHDARNGNMVAVRARYWNCDRTVAYPRLSMCSMNCIEKWRMGAPPEPGSLLEDEFIGGFNMPIFVEDAQLRAAMPAIGRLHRGEPASAQGVEVIVAPSPVRPASPKKVTGEAAVEAEIRRLLLKARAENTVISQSAVLAALEVKFPGKLRGKRHLEKLEKRVYEAVYAAPRNTGRIPGKASS